MKKKFSWFVKVFIAGVLALLIASAICLLYYNPGIHITDKTGTTDYVWQKNRFASTMTEGIAWNRTDKNGYYNEVSSDENIDILLMGSSHMEGVNVFPKQKTSWLLGELTDQSVYNVGISGHDLLACVKNLDTALSNMQPTEYVIIETGTTTFTAESINECISGNMLDIPSYDSGLLFHLQKIPYLKLLYAQLKSWTNLNNNEPVVQANEESNSNNNKELINAYNQLIQHIYAVCNAHHVQPIIFYHPHLNVSDNGTASATLDASLELFQSACQTNEVLFIDMTEDFINMYNEKNVLPHGFCNTAIGVGHLNKFGHEAISERLAETISKNLCYTEVLQK